MNHSTKLSRRSLLLLLSGAFTTTIATASEAAKKGKRNRGDREYPIIERRQRLRDLPDSSPTPTPSPAPSVPEPYRPTSPALMLGVGGGVLGGFALLGAWLVKASQKSTSPPPVQRRAKTVKQATPEIADWYVFRSGKAEGPYTALQLWEVQKITDRTKVRRGEAEWQRAGEVSELAKYLSKK